MSPLAQSIYRQLLKHVRRKKASVTYGELAGANAIHPRSPRLHAALGEISNACRHAHLPCLPAVVWRASTRRPSSGYYKVAHPRAHTDDQRASAWQREHVRVMREIDRFPRTLT